ncbi:hypothetical protein ABIC65_000756 [Sphingomonas trueperi]|uniref:hypothetical protein n=1 Tax=Sphingomonas trueperi TaxID=53317 RepID=UPI003392DF5C
MSDDQQAVEATDSYDGLKQWRLLRRPHGLYFYEEKTLEKEVYLIEEDGSAGAVVVEAYWSPTHVSGLFDTRDAARTDALATLPWLRKALERPSRTGG